MCGGDERPPTLPFETPAHLEPKTRDSAGEGDLVVEDFPITFEGYTYVHGKIAYVKGRAPSPVVLVHHNYAGLKQFDIDQACFLARVGYVGLAVDCYKDSESYAYSDRNPLASCGEERRETHFIGAFDEMNRLLWNPQHWRGLMHTYLETAFRHPAVSEGRAAAIGYCLGGQSCLEQVRAGHQLQAVVTFHGLLNSRPMPQGTRDPLTRISAEQYQKEVDLPECIYTPGCRVVIENGTHDHHVEVADIIEFMQEMDSREVDWRINNHARTPHGFALSPGVTATCYRERADRRSTLSMLATFAEAWPEFSQFHVPANACGTTLPYYLSISPKL